MSRRAVPPPSVTDPLAAAAARFRGDLTRLVGPGAGPVLLAVSGGPDSMAMLTLGATAPPGAVIAASVDHRLRPEAATEAASVAAWCERLGVPHATLVPAEQIEGASIQAQARTARYGLLADHARRVGRDRDRHRASRRRPGRDIPDARGARFGLVGARGRSRRDRDRRDSRGPSTARLATRRTARDRAVPRRALRGRFRPTAIPRTTAPASAG